MGNAHASQYRACRRCSLPTSFDFPLIRLGHLHPRGVHPIGGTAVPPVLGRFKGMGFLREGADSPYQGEMFRRDKRGRVLEIPLPLGSSKVNCPEGAREGGLGHLVTFCLHRKSLARGRNTFFFHLIYGGVFVL